jgi:hypothetical protein
MKTLLALLILLVAPTLGAQQQVSLGAPDWYDDRIWDIGAASFEDGEYATLVFSGEQLTNIMWTLERTDSTGNIEPPDSIVFIVDGTAEAYVFSTYGPDNLWEFGRTAESGRMSFPYKRQKGKRVYRVGIAADTRLSDGFENLGGKRVDCAYAIYDTPTDILPNDTVAVDTPKLYVKRDTETENEKLVWSNLLGQIVFEGSYNELIASKQRGAYISKKYRLLLE